MGRTGPWTLWLLYALTPRVLQASGCHDSTTSTDSGGDPCSYYVGQTQFCGCCDHSLFSASDCCACQQRTDASTDTNASWWSVVFQTWPSKATALRLPGKGIQGRLPADLAERWPHLVEVDLSQNRLTGHLPAEIGRLANLSHLDLSRNDFKGTLPGEIGRLPKLRHLLLASNQLEGKFPPEMGGLSRSLERLDLSHNRFVDALPPELGNLTQLQRLYLHNNRFRGGIPRELGELTRLLDLQLHVNTFGGTIPQQLGQLRSLQTLYLHSNMLSGCLPAELGNLRSLQRLSLYNNSLSGNLPPELSRLQGLQRLWLQNNAFTGRLPSSLGNLTSLQSLILRNNMLDGWLPGELGNLVNLKVLYADNNNFGGRLPRALGRLRSLRILALHANQLSGPLPRELGSLGCLRQLSLHTNNLEGTLPAELGNLTSLQQLRLSSNRFSGALPPALGNLGKLELLELRNNLLIGSLPPDLGGLRSLQVLNLRNNWLSGQLPAQLGNLTSLKELQLRNNKFTGSLPPELGNLATLKYLYLQNNLLSTGLPAELGRLTSLQILRLHNNRLHGGIPRELGNLVSLQQLDLWGGQLTGPLPADLGNLRGLLTLRLQDNQLTGSLPAELGQLTKLETLSLNFNRFTGRLPCELGRLGRLQVLHLQGNRLEGSLPPALGNLSRLQALNLQNNRLSGGLPSSFASLKRLQELRAAWNYYLCGGGEVLEGLDSLTRLELRGCCFQDMPGLPRNLEYLDLGKNRLEEIPKRWQEQSRKSLKTLLLDGNRITHWDTSSIVPRSYRLENSWLCGYTPPGRRLAWLVLERLDISSNPLSVPVYDFLESLSHLTWLSAIEARDANLTGEVPYVYWARLVPGVPHTGEKDCTGLTASEDWVSFPALLTLDLAGNSITALQAMPSTQLVQADLSRNALTALHPRWLTGGINATLQRFDARANPELRLPVRLNVTDATDVSDVDVNVNVNVNVTGACPVLGTTELIANAHGWSASADGRTECTSLCPMDKTRLQLDVTVNESVLCRCARGQGVGLRCSACPDGTFSSLSFSSRQGHYTRSCLGCPRNSELRYGDGDGDGDGQCFADCHCSEGYFMIMVQNQSQSQESGDDGIGGGQCTSLSPETEGRCEPCGLFKTSASGSRKRRDCFCNSNASSGGWGNLRQRHDTCGCPEGFHMNFADRRCEECLPQEDCGDWTRSLEPPRVRKSFWALPPPPRGGDGTFGNFSRHVIWLCRSSSACPGNFTCGEHRTGTACSLCEWGHFSTPSGSCAPCPRSYLGTRRMLACLLLACMVFPILAQAALTADTHSRGLVMTLRSLRTSLRQIVKFAQVLGLVSLFRVEWPPLVESIFEVFRAFSLDLASWTGVACLDRHQQQTMTFEVVFRWTLPLAGVLVTCLAALLVTGTGRALDPLVGRCCPQRRKRTRQLLSFPPLDVLRVLLFFLYLFFPSILKNALLPLTCTASPNGLLTMNAFPHVVCWSSSSEQHEPDSAEAFWSVALPSLCQSTFLVLGFPILLLFAWRRIGAAETPLQQEQRKRWWAFVFEDFRSHKGSWGLVAVCKDIVVNLVVVLMPGLGTAQLLITSLMAGLYACRAFCTLPYRDMSNNLLEICTSSAVATLCLFSAGMGFQRGPDMDMPDLGEHVAGGSDGSDYFVRAISLACLQGLSLVAPVSILTFQVLMAFERSRRLIPRCLQPLSEEQREEWSQLFTTSMGLQGSALPQAVAQMDSLDFSTFQRSMTSAPVARDTLKQAKSSSSSTYSNGSTCVGSSSSWSLSEMGCAGRERQVSEMGLEPAGGVHEEYPEVDHRSNRVEEAADLVPGLREEIAALRAENVGLRWKIAKISTQRSRHQALPTTLGQSQNTLSL